MSDLLDVLAASQRAGFLGPGPVAQHVTQASAFEAAVDDPPASFLDLGSGGGVPGLVLALAWRSAAVTLLDSQLRRVRFLLDAIETLGLTARATAVHARAEDLAHDPAHRGRYAVVTARSFGAPALTAECGVAFLQVKGLLLVAEPQDAPADRWPPEGLARLGLSDEGVVANGAGTVRRLRSSEGPPSATPRRAAAMTRTPRF